MVNFKKFLGSISANPSSEMEQVNETTYKFWCDGIDEDVLKEFCVKHQLEYDFIIIEDWYDKSQGEENSYGGTERLEVTIFKRTMKVNIKIQEGIAINNKEEVLDKLAVDIHKLIEQTQGSDVQLNTGLNILSEELLLNIEDANRPSKENSFKEFKEWKLMMCDKYSCDITIDKEMNECTVTIINR